MRGTKNLTLALSAICLVVVTACSSGQETTKPNPSGSPAPSQSTAPANQPAKPGAGGAQGQSRLDVVKQRGKLICGVNNVLAGFGFMGSDGKYSGFDVDFCKALAAALFDDPNQVEYRPLNASQRFTAVQTGEVDVLIRNTTWTLNRDTELGLEFAPVTFYDGQGMMVRKDSGIKTLKDFQGKAVCVQTGTTTELNLADAMRKAGVTFKPVVFNDAASTSKAYDENRCDGYTTDRSGLIAQRTQLQKPTDHAILTEVMSKEPLAPAVLNGDSKWFDAVKWVVSATIEGEEMGVSSQNLGSFKESKDPSVRRFLGMEGKLGEDLGLTKDFAARVIRHVGNYGEIYDRNLGPATPFNLPRSLNSLWTQGGLLYSPPFR